jgi:hypothetical protein
MGWKEERKKNLQISRKNTHSLIQIMRLRQRGHDKNHQKHIRRRMRELVVSLERDLDCNPKRFYAHDGYGADQGADTHVDDGVCAAASGREPVNGEEGVDYYEEEVGQEDFPDVSITTQRRTLGKERRTRLSS